MRKELLLTAPLDISDKMKKSTLLKLALIVFAILPLSGYAQLERPESENKTDSICYSQEEALEMLSIIDDYPRVLDVLTNCEKSWNDCEKSKSLALKANNALMKDNWELTDLNNKLNFQLKKKKKRTFRNIAIAAGVAAIGGYLYGRSRE